MGLRCRAWGMGLKLEIKVKVGMDTFINKVEASGIITVDLLDYEPKEKSFFSRYQAFSFYGNDCERKGV